VLVLTADPHRAAICTGAGKALFLQQERGRWHIDRPPDVPGWTQALAGAFDRGVQERMRDSDALGAGPVPD